MLVMLRIIYVLWNILVGVCRVRRDVARIHRQPPVLGLRGSSWGTAISRSELKNSPCPPGCWRVESSPDSLPYSVRGGTPPKPSPPDPAHSVGLSGGRLSVAFRRSGLGIQAPFFGFRRLLLSVLFRQRCFCKNRYSVPAKWSFRLYEIMIFAESALSRPHRQKYIPESEKRRLDS